jgi:motility quorum-sensing regulator/GCU-specific mRNA interferase toxin
VDKGSFSATKVRPSTPAGDVYLKLTVIDDVLIVSFKAL